MKGAKFLSLRVNWGWLPGEAPHRLRSRLYTDRPGAPGWGWGALRQKTAPQEGQKQPWAATPVPVPGERMWQ